MMHEYSQICANKCASAKYGAWSSLVKMSTTQVTLEDSGNPLATLSAFGINDEECQVTNDGHRAQMREVHQVGFCAICQVEASVRRVTVRGLCQLSMFDR